MLRLSLLLATAILLGCGARTDPTAFDLTSSSSDSTSVGVGGGAGGMGGAPTCTAELCNGIDDDCDGQIDEEHPNDGADCLTGFPGQCAAGTVFCIDGALACVPNAPVQPEICDGIDNDCNGIIDEFCDGAKGCSDGTREGFVDEEIYPAIAGCSGGWSIPGLLSDPKPACSYMSGNTSSNPTGSGCSAADLCAPGFHVCKGAGDVALRSVTGCVGAASAPGLFFATRQGSTGCGVCTLGMLVDLDLCSGCSCASGCAPNDTTANDLFGCGTLGAPPAGDCGVLDVSSWNACDALGAPWVCGGDGCNESNAVVKLGPQGGGVLCCAD